jgi:hypothetical protein
MKSIMFAIAGLLISATVFSQKEIRDANAQVRTVKSFHAIDVSSGIELILVQGNEETVAVSANTIELRDNIRTVVEGGVLKIYFDQKFYKKNYNNRRLKAYVSAIKLDGLEISSGALVKTEGSLKSPGLTMRVSSGAVFKGEVEVNDLDVDQSSGSIVNISGKAEKLKVEGSSGSMFNGYELETETSDADISSGGHIKITVNKELSAEATSGGAISYQGKGVIRNIRTSSGGGISRKG